MFILKINYLYQSFINVYFHVLSLIYSKDNLVTDIKTEGEYFMIIQDVLNVNKEQLYYDSLLNINSFVSVKNNSKKLYFIYKWYNDVSEDWSIEKLFSVLRNSDVLTNELGKRARLRVKERYTLEQNIDSLEKIYSSLLN